MSFGTQRARPQMIGPADFAGDLLHGVEVAFAGHREAGFDDIDTQPGELAGDFEFLAQVHRRAGALLAIAERRVEDDDAVVFHISFMFLAARLLEKQKPHRRFGSGVWITQIQPNTQLPRYAAAARSAAVECFQYRSLQPEP